MRWFPLLALSLVAACDSTFDPEPPVELASATHAFSINRKHLYTVDDVGEVHSYGTAIPSPTDSEGNPVSLDLPIARDIAVGERHACVISTTGSVHCWGDHTNGALGAHRTCIPPQAEGGAPDCTLPSAIMPALPPTRALVAGDDVTCAILEDRDRVVCWGQPGARLGGSVLPSLDPPTPVKDETGAFLTAEKLFAFHGDICALGPDERLRCWGDSYGAVPQLQPQFGVIDLAVGERHSCIIDRDGLGCWGDNRNGQIDFGVARSCSLDEPCVIPERMAIHMDAVRVVVGERHTCVLDSTNVTRCFGSNEVGQLGDRTDAFLVGDVGVALSVPVTALGAGYTRTCGVTPGHSLWCWGQTMETN